MCTACRRREVEGSRLYKADCERRALRWVECLLEPDISKELLEQAVGLRIALPLRVTKSGMRVWLVLRSSYASSNLCCDVYFPFLRQSQHITQNHYDDVVEERNIERLCGYPMCDRKLGPISRQKYHISVERRQVFDVTERKVEESCQRSL